MQIRKMVLAGITVATVFFAGIVIGAQPHMVNALRSLEAAKAELKIAEKDKAGHRLRLSSWLTLPLWKSRPALTPVLADNVLY